MVEYIPNMHETLGLAPNKCKMDVGVHAYNVSRRSRSSRSPLVTL